MDNLVLTPQQERKLLSAYAHIAVLIGAADGNMDEDEKAWSKKIISIRSFSGHESLRGFYEKLEHQIEDRVNTLLDKYQLDPAEREKKLIENLKEVNDILGQLPTKFGAMFYDDLISYAKHIAKASGGFLRFFSVGPNEKKWVDLPMIDRIVWEGDEE